MTIFTPASILEPDTSWSVDDGRTAAVLAESVRTTTRHAADWQLVCTMTIAGDSSARCVPAEAAGESDSRDTQPSGLPETRQTCDETAVEVDMTRKFFTVAALIVLWGFVVTPAQGPGLNRLMEEKLAHAQHILRAVVTSDWIALETHSRELERLTRDPAWMVLQFHEYRVHSEAFVRAVQTLHRAAAQRDLESTPHAYVEVTLQCVQCHRYLARARLAE